MARVRAEFESEASFHPLLGDVLRPVVRVSVQIAGRSAAIWMQIDTGADYTALSPAHARAVLGAAYQGIDFDRDIARLTSTGSAAARVST